VAVELHGDPVQILRAVVPRAAQAQALDGVPWDVLLPVAASDVVAVAEVQAHVAAPASMNAAVAVVLVLHAEEEQPYAAVLVVARYGEQAQHVGQQALRVVRVLHAEEVRRVVLVLREVQKRAASRQRYAQQTNVEALNNL
jgi:hypothetical protein